MLVETVLEAQPAMDYGGIHHPLLAIHFLTDQSDSNIRFLERRNCKFVKIPMIIHFGSLIPPAVTIITIINQNNTNCLVYYI